MMVSETNAKRVMAGTTIWSGDKTKTSLAASSVIVRSTDVLTNICYTVADEVALRSCEQS
jgi:hypothetical protein